MIGLLTSSEERIKGLQQAVLTTALTNEQALAYIYELFQLNEHTPFLTVHERQQLWLKCMKKYKFKLHEWQALQAEKNIHHFLLQDAGEGYLTVLKLYKERNLTLWYDDAFEVALQTLVTTQQGQLLQLFLLSTLICNESYHHFFTEQPVQQYFLNHHSDKIRQLYSAYMSYNERQTSESSTHLYKMLAKYNPHYKIQAKKTPLFFKQLAQLSQCHKSMQQLESSSRKLNNM